MLVAAAQHDIIINDLLKVAVSLEHDRTDHVDQASEITDRDLLDPCSELIIKLGAGGLVKVIRE